MMLPPDPVYVFKGDMDSISCLSYKISQKVEYIYAGTVSGKVHIWSLKTKREIGNFKSGDDVCLSVNIAEEDGTVITQNKSGKISFWKEEDDGQRILINQMDTNFFGFCKSSIFQDLLYVALKDCNFEVISTKTKETVKKFKLSCGEKLGEVMAFKVITLKGEMYVLVAFEGHQLILWTAKTLEKISALQMTECPMAIDYDTGTNRGICGNPSNQLLIFSISKNLELKAERTVTLMNEGIASVQIRPDGKLVAVGCWDGNLKLYSWKSLVLLAVLDTHSSTVQDVCFIKSYETGKLKYLLAAASKDSKISLWDIYN